MPSKFNYMISHLYTMAEATLEQVILLSDCFEAGDQKIARSIIDRDDELDRLEKEIDNLSQNAILEAVASRGISEPMAGRLMREDPLIFALSAIRFSRFFERMGDQVVNCARAYLTGSLTTDYYREDTKLNLLLSRVITSVGMSVESLIEQKEKFFGSIHSIEKEIDSLSAELFDEICDWRSFTHRQLLDYYRMILALERIGDISVNITEELIRLATGQDIRHMDFEARGSVFRYNEIVLPDKPVRLSDNR